MIITFLLMGRVEEEKEDHHRRIPISCANGFPDVCIEEEVACSRGGTWGWGSLRGLRFGRVEAE